MCLYKTHWFPKIAWKPIKCYKIVRHCGNSSFCTLHTHYAYTLNEPIKHSYSSFGFFKRELTGEVVHAYTNIIAANMNRFNLVECILECTIPKFSLYWLGNDDEICSRKIIPIKIY